MSKWYCVKLLFNTPLHIGSPYKGIGVENTQPFISSDTIFSALCNVWIKYGILTSEELNKAVPELNIIFSSAFPFLRIGDSASYFLPTPVYEPNSIDKLIGSEEEKDSLKKKLKKSPFIPLELFRNYLIENSYFRKSYDKVLDDIFAYKSVYKEKLSVRHAQDRISSASQPYYVGQTYFDPELGGLYFVVKLDDELVDWTNIFNEGLRALAKEGFGGLRSTMGTFIVNEEYGTLKMIEKYDDLFFLTIEGPSEKIKYCLLSVYFPIDGELDLIKKNNDNIYYELIHRKGWTYSTSTYYQLKKKSIYLFKEGSLFNFPVIGNVIDIKPDDFPHPVWKCGKALTVQLRTS